MAVPDWLGPTNPAVRRRPLGVSLPLIAFEVVMAALAIVLTPASRPRAGLLPQRRGPAEAPALLAGPFGLAWRLQRAAFLGWRAFVVLSLIVGQIVTRIGDMLGTPVARQLITALGGVGELTKAFVAVD